jgi:signal transduction histidine kinase
MNVWADKVEDIRFSLNDLYMVFLMAGWMFFFMGIYYKDIKITLIGLGSVLLNIWYIRTQFVITPRQYVMGMIPHHSMAVHMSRQLLKNQSPPKLRELAKNIIKTQEEEIQYMKGILT